MSLWNNTKATGASSRTKFFAVCFSLRLYRWPKKSSASPSPQILANFCQKISDCALKETPVTFVRINNHYEKI